MTIYEQNITALYQINEKAATAIHEAKETDQYQVVQKEGFPVSLVYKKDNAETLSIHSQYDPIKEATKLVDGYDLPLYTNLIIFGFGLGYHIFEILNRSHHRDFVIICEKCPYVIKLAFSQFDFLQIINRKNVFWSVGDNGIGLDEALKQRSFSLLANGITVVKHPTLYQVAAAYYKALEEVSDESYIYAKVNINTQIERSRDFVGNSFKNTPHFLKAQPISNLFGIAEGLPVFIVSAGPSLDKTIHHLKKIGDKGYVIVVDSALKMLLDHDIFPDLVISIDYTEHTVGYFQNISTENLSLAFDSEIYPKVLDIFQGTKYAIQLPLKSIPSWLKKVVGDKGTIEKGLSVSHAAMLIAKEMKASQIILVGQDLAYPKAQWHTKGSNAFQTLDVADEEVLSLCEVEDIFGEKVKSSVSMRIFKNHFEVLIPKLGIQCLDATEGGAKIQGTILMSLREAIIRFCDKNHQKKDLNVGNLSDSYADLHAVVSEARTLLVRMEKFNQNVKFSLEKVSRLLKQFQENKDKARVKMGILEVQGITKLLDQDEDILLLLRDVATEAMLMREKRTFRIGIPFEEYTDEEIFKNLKKEELFFSLLLTSSHYMAAELAHFANKHAINLEPALN